MSNAAAKIPGQQELFETPVEKPEGEKQEAPVKVEAKQADAEPEIDASEGVDSLKRQLDDLRRSEQAAKQQADQFAKDRAEAIRQAQERQVQLTQSQYQSSEGRLLAVNNAIVAATAEAEKAQNDLVRAGEEQNFTALADAQRRLARAEARLETLETGKADLEAQVQQQKSLAERQAQWLQQQRQQQAQQGDQLDQTNLPQRAKEWLRAHPEYLNDPRKNAKLQALHWDVKDETGEEFTDRYFTRVEELLGMRKAQQREDYEDDPPVRQERRSAPVSAPVSREAPATSGGKVNSTSQVRLTAAQREAAKLAGITEAEYAKNLIKMNQAKTDGLIQ